MTKKPALILLCMLWIAQGFAQINNFDLSEYKLPNLNRKTLNMEFNLSGQNVYDKFPSADSLQQSQNYYQRFGTNHNNDYQFSFSPQYMHYINKPHLQKESLLNIDFLTRYGKDKSEGQVFEEKGKSKNSDLYADITYNDVYRWYYQTNNFFETDILINYQAQKSLSNREQSDSRQYTDDYNNRINKINIEVPIKWGIGRIEQVQAARHAVYLFNELSKIGKIKSNINNEDILKLASFISELKNKRFFDSRKRQKFEYKALDSFLTDEGYLIKSDMDYFSTLAEFWRYGSLQVRNSGKRLSFVFQPGYLGNFLKLTDKSVSITEQRVYDYNSYSYIYAPRTDKRDNINSFNSKLLNLKAGMEYLYENPIDLKWQNTISAYIKGGFLMGKINGEAYSSNEVDGPIDLNYLNESGDTLDTDIGKPYFEIGYYQKFGWYPTTRTAVYFNYSGKYAQFIKQSGKEGSNLNFDSKAIKLATELRVQYYISEKLRLGVLWELFYQWQNSENNLVTNFDSSDLGLTNYYWFQYDNISTQDIYRKNRFYQNFSINLSYSIF